MTTFDIPKTCRAGVTVDEGPNFRLEVQDVDVPEPGILTRLSLQKAAPS